jgi:hypothetical protein
MGFAYSVKDVELSTIAMLSFAATMATPGVFVASLPFSHLPNDFDIGPSTYL